VPDLTATAAPEPVVATGVDAAVGGSEADKGLAESAGLESVGALEEEGSGGAGEERAESRAVCCEAIETSLGVGEPLCTRRFFASRCFSWPVYPR
jgi:hypothetical protein